MITLNKVCGKVNTATASFNVSKTEDIVNLPKE